MLPNRRRINPIAVFQNHAFITVTPIKPPYTPTDRFQLLAIAHIAGANNRYVNFFGRRFRIFVQQLLLFRSIRIPFIPLRQRVFGRQFSVTGHTDVVIALAHRNITIIVAGKFLNHPRQQFFDFSFVFIIVFNFHVIKRQSFVFAVLAFIKPTAAANLPFAAFLFFFLPDHAPRMRVGYAVDGTTAAGVAEALAAGSMLAGKQNPRIVF